jgi:hypothetical protein
MIGEGVSTARAPGCSGTLVARMDSAFYGAPAVRAARQAGAYFSVTVRMDLKVRATIADAHVAEVPYTAFTSRKGQAVTARLIVRRVRDLNKKAAPGQGELFAAWRYHAVFTDSPVRDAPGRRAPPRARPG